jgi:cyclopropane fatty-acyl-phospholipid synthase-like methyltransferase
MGLTFLHMIDVGNCKSILEAGCGDGHLAVEIALQK